MASSDWTNVDVDSLNADTQEMYQAAKQAYAAYKQARKAFEDNMQVEFCEYVPAGMELKFGYNFGKLSIAVGPAREAKAAAKPKQSLAQFLAGHSASGRAI